MPPPAASASSPAAATSLGAPALWGSPSSPTPADDLDMLRHRGLCRILGVPPASAAPGRAVPGTEEQLWHLPAAPAWAVPPTRCAPSLAAPVPHAQAAARGRWPWHSRCRPWPAEDAEWHRLRRGLGSIISITPPWAGSAPGACGPQEPGTAPARGTGGDSDPRAEPNPAPARLWRFHRAAIIGQGKCWVGCRTTTSSTSSTSSTSTRWLNAQIGYSPGAHSVLGNTSVPGQKPAPTLGRDSLHPGTKCPSIPVHTTSTPTAHLEHTSAGLHSLFEVRNSVFTHFCTRQLKLPHVAPSSCFSWARLGRTQPWTGMLPTTGIPGRRSSIPASAFPAHPWEVKG